MSAENVEAVHRFVAAMSASPEEVRASAAEFWDPDADFYPVPKFPDSQPCHGLNEISRFFGRFRDTWFRYEMPLKEVIEVDDERILARSTLRAEGRESGVNLEAGIRVLPSPTDRARFRLSCRGRCSG